MSYKMKPVFFRFLNLHSQQVARFCLNNLILYISEQISISPKAILSHSIPWSLSITPIGSDKYRFETDIVPWILYVAVQMSVIILLRTISEIKYFASELLLTLCLQKCVCK